MRARTLSFDKRSFFVQLFDYARFSTSIVFSSRQHIWTDEKVDRGSTYRTVYSMLGSI